MSNLIRFKHRGNFPEFMALYREKAHRAGLDDEWINGIFKTIKDISDEVSIYFRELIHQFALHLFDLHIQMTLLMDSMDIRDVH